MSAHPFDHLIKTVTVGDKTVKVFDITKLGENVAKLPVTIRILLECVARNCDNFSVTPKDVENVVNWESTAKKVEVPFRPARVLMQDFTGVPAVVDLAAMRDCVARLKGDAMRVNPLVPVDLVVDHSVQVDVSRRPDAVQQNETIEFERNQERFSFLKWGSKAFEGLTIVPPGNGIVHQINCEYLARVAFVDDKTGYAYPDTLVGTDSHTTMVNGLGCLGWGVGGIEAEAAMLGQASSMVLPAVVGVKLTGSLPSGATATDLVLTLTAMLRKHGVVEKFVEFYGPGIANLSLADRATISNMAPEYGATCGYFPVDEISLRYMAQTGRPAQQVEMTKQVLSALGLFGAAAEGIAYTEHLELELSTVQPCIAGPKRPHDRVLVAEQKEDFAKCLATESGFKGFAVPEDKRTATMEITANGQKFTVGHGVVTIAAITSCTNTSNPSVLIAAGLVAKKAQALGLTVPPYVKTSLSPGSQVVKAYLENSGLLKDLEGQGFSVAGYGCMTCIGNSGELYEGVSEAIKSSGVVASAVLSGNRNFEARVHPLTVANYLASPPLVVAYALAGTTNINLLTDVIGKDKDGKDIHLKDIWPTTEEISGYVEKYVTADTFTSVYSNIKKGNERWDKLEVPTDVSQYQWAADSTYIHNPPFFQTVERELPTRSSITNARCLLLLGDSVTTDHISPAGNIAATSSAAQYLTKRGVAKSDFNTYGARRGNDEVMARGTFANTRLGNRIIGAGTTGPVTKHFPDGEQMSVFDASEKYKSEGVGLIVLAGKEYGSGSSRDWAAKGPYMLGIQAVIAESFERIHRSNLVGMGIAPLCFMPGETAATHGLNGSETFTLDFGGAVQPQASVKVIVNGGEKTFEAKLRFDTDAEVTYYLNGGVLPYVLRSKILA
eukprot:PhM_4_TR5182/c1_g1_i1/m.99094/K01681/ACO, acnA; aconitate hydratase